MQSIDSVSRAKAFIRSHARSAALAIVPLAAVVTAHAGPVVNLPTGHYNCSFSIVGGSGGACSGSATTNVGAPGQIGGTSFFLASGGLNLGSSGGSIIMTVSGPVGAAIPSGTVIPVSWVFDMNQQTDPPWSITYSLGDTSTPSVLGTHTFSGNNSGEVTGNGSFVTTAASLADDTISLRINFTESGDPEGGVNVIVSIPEGTSIDILPINTSGVPEPSTLGLLGAGLGWLGYRWRNRRDA